MCFLLLITLFSSNGVLAENQFKVFLNKKEMLFEEPIFLENSRIYVPVRFISEEVGANVTWNGNNRSVGVTSPNGDKLRFYIDSKKVEVNGDYYIMDVAPKIEYDRTYLPVRHVSEFLHSVVLWDSKTESANIYNVPVHEVQTGETIGSIAKQYGTTVEMLKKRNNLLTNDIAVGHALKVIVPETMEKSPNLDLLASLIHAEANGESLKGKIAVGNVVMNRIEDQRFPNSLNGVILEPNQFTPVKTGKIYNVVPDQQSYEAAIRAVEGESYAADALFFFNPAKTSDSFVWSRPVVMDIGNHRFAK